jgi:hypothetical protein
MREEVARCSSSSGARRAGSRPTPGVPRTPRGPIAPTDPVEARPPR